MLRGCPCALRCVESIASKLACPPGLMPATAPMPGASGYSACFRRSTAREAAADVASCTDGGRHSIPVLGKAESDHAAGQRAGLASHFR